MLDMEQKPALLDARGRALRDLRVSVTDRCNFRCRYCMPREQFTGKPFLPRGEILSFEEISRVARILSRKGLEKIRITGGEPLLRRGLPHLVESLAQLGLDLALTTNGVLLEKQAHALRAAGLNRLTVSLDAIDEDTFQVMSDAPAWSSRDVLRGIEAAERAGFSSIKINCVVRRGVNAPEIRRVARHFLGSPHVVRFIEFMDVGNVNGWQLSHVVSAETIRAELSSLGTLGVLQPRSTGEVARRYELCAPDGRTLEVGVISSVTQPFCGSCTRLRLAADGRLFTCLFASEGHDLKALLRGPADDAQVLEWLNGMWSSREDRYSEQRAAMAATGTRDPRRHLVVIAPRAEMSYLGG